MPYVESCCVADQHCEAAANFDWHPRIRTTCAHCCQVVCRKCSSLRMYHGRRVRLCNDCQITELDGGDDAVVMVRIHHLSGYPSVTPTSLRASREKMRTVAF